MKISTHGLFKDITGKIFGCWKVISYAGNYYWNCECSCGTIRKVLAGTLRNGTSHSCGCFRRNTTIKRNITHGQAFCDKRTPEYMTWLDMKKRCLNKKTASYKNYGGRGIKICKEWLDSFEKFFADIGKKPSNIHSLERIDNEGNYEAINCRWATRKEQSNNKRSSRFVQYGGEKLTLMQVSTLCKINYHTLIGRINRGLSLEEALNTPIQTKGNKL